MSARATLAGDNNVAPAAPADSAAAALAAAPAEEPWRWERTGDAVRAYAVFGAVLALGALPAAQDWRDASLAYFSALAATTIYLGAHRGLNQPQRQEIGLKQGALAPVAASAALFGIYLVVKYFPDLSFQTAADAYFALIGAIAASGALAAPARTLAAGLGAPAWRVPIPSWLGAVDGAGAPVADAPLAPTDLLVAAAAIALVYADYAAHHGNHSLNNAIACLVAADILQLIGLSSFRVAALLLSGLLAYDVFWVFLSPAVFGDNVMLSVATSDAISGPTRLLFPRPPGSTGEASSFPFSLLGLGDVAVPGLLACLALRYDATRAVDLRVRGAAAAAALAAAIDGAPPGATGRQLAEAAGAAAEAAYDGVAEREAAARAGTEGGGGGGAGPAWVATDAVMEQRTYFGPVMAAYIAGLLAAFAANSATGLGQPALLYLCPLTLGAVAAMAAARGELGRIWAFRDSAPRALTLGGGGAAEDA